MNFATLVSIDLENSYLTHRRGQDSIVRFMMVGHFGAKMLTLG
jgi:hypothetical protein